MHTMNVAIFTDVHRAFVQRMLAHGAVKASDAEAMFREVVQEFGGSSAGRRYDFDTVIGDLNDSLRHMQMLLQRVRSDYDSEPYWVLVNSASDDLAKEASPLKDWQVSTFKRMIEVACTLEANGSVPLADIYGFAGAVTKAEVNKFLASMCRQSWLRYDDDEDSYKLGVRCFAELLKELQEAGAAPCPTCKDLVIVGKACKNPACGLRFHADCSPAVNQGRGQCPTCKFVQGEGQPILAPRPAAPAPLAAPLAPVAPVAPVAHGSSGRAPSSAAPAPPPTRRSMRGQS